MSNKPTGYPRGRPRKGEVRPPSANAIYGARYRAKKKKLDPEGWAEYQREVSRKWRAEHPERAREFARNAAKREAAWRTLELKEAVIDCVESAQHLADYGPPRYLRGS